MTRAVDRGVGGRREGMTGSCDPRAAGGYK